MSDLKQYQVKAISDLRMSRSLGVFYEQGLGKTRIIIEEICTDDDLSFILIICPKTLIPTWCYQISLWAPPYFDISEIRKEDGFCRGRYLFNIVSVDFFSRKKNFLKLKYLLEDVNSYMVVDESSSIKNHKSIRTKELLKLSKICNGKKRIMNGTPITQTPFDLYSQMSFLSDKIFEQKSFYAFQNYYGEMRFRHISPYTGFNELVKYRNMEELMNRAKKLSISLTKADAKLEIPDKIFQKIPVVIYGKQLALYKKLLKECKVDLGDLGDFLVSHSFSRMNKLHQILSGFIYTKNMHEELEESVVEGAIGMENAKLKVLKDLVSFSGDKNILIWCRFIKEVEIIYKAINEMKISCMEMHSNIPIEEIDKYTSGEKRILIITLNKGAKGLTLVNTDIVIFFSNSYSIEARMHAEDRCHRIGLNHSVIYYDLIVEKTIDDKLYRHIVEKKEFNETLLEWLS